MEEKELITIDKNSDIPIYIQLGESIYELIQNGIFKSNQRLPPIRKLANKLNVNTITIINAYKYLENKKIVYSKAGSGTYVSELNLNEIPKPIIKQTQQFKLYNIPNKENTINFASTSVPPELFPVPKFKVLFNKVLDRDKGNAFNYNDGQGYLPLREELCNYLDNNSIKTSPDKIQIISGAQQGIDIISKVMLSQGDIVFVEKPTYYGAVGAILSRGAKVIEIPMLNDGIDTKKLKSLLNVYSPKFIYIMTYYQTPTCISYSLDKKRELLEIANANNLYIIEEDNLSDFSYTDTTIIPLKTLDYKNKVIYIKSFSKILMPGLRIGFMVLPKIISENVLSAKYSTDISTSSFIQRAFELYIKSNDWTIHLEEIKNIFKSKYNIILKAIDKYLYPFVEYDKPNGGLCIWLKLVNVNFDADKLCNELIKNNIIITPGSMFSLDGSDINSHIRISFSNVSNDNIELGVKTISDVIKYLTTVS